MPNICGGIWWHRKIGVGLDVLWKKSGKTFFTLCLPFYCVQSVHFSSVAWSCSTLCNPMDARLPCTSPTPGACSSSCPLSQWYHPTIVSSCHPLLLLPSIFPGIRVFSNESALHIRWPKYHSFSFIISPSNEYSELISFRIDWFDLLAVQGTLKSLSSPAPQFESINSSTFSLLYGPILTSIHHY